MADIRSGINKLPFIGGITEGLFGSPEQEEMQRQMQKAQQAYQQYRPQVMEARMNAFNNTSNAFNGTNNLIGQMYGQQFAPDMSKIVQNPFPEQMQKGMYADAFGNTPQNKFYDPAQAQAADVDFKSAMKKGGNPDQMMKRAKAAKAASDKKFRG